MSATLSLLLYLQVINLGGHYTDCEIYEQENLHQTEMQAIENDPGLYENVLIIYENAESLVVIDESCGG